MSYRYTTQDVKTLLARTDPKKNKFGAKRVQVDNIWFDSKREAARYNELKLMALAGLIKALLIHSKFEIPPTKTGDFDMLPYICDVVLDFDYWDVQKQINIYEDVKGKDNPLSQLKRKLVEAFYGIKVTLVK